MDNAPAKIKLALEVDDGGFVDTNVDGVPGANHKYLATEAVVEDGQSLLVGGFQYENVGSNMSGVPGLSSIPGVGSLFRRTHKSHQQVERLFLITPRVVSAELNDTDTMQAVLPIQAAHSAPPGTNRATSINDDSPQFQNIWSRPARSIDAAPPNVLPAKPLPPVPNKYGYVDHRRDEAAPEGEKKQASKAGDEKAKPSIQKEEGNKKTTPSTALSGGTSSQDASSAGTR
jgi:hypothetical protein